MVAPTRFTSGVSTANKGTALWNYPMPDPTKVYTFFDDFTAFVSTDWTETKIGAGGSIALVADEPFGAVNALADALDNDGIQEQWALENFTVATGKKIWFKTRFKVSDATQSDLAIGLIVLDTTILGATDGAGVTDGIFFSKDDGAATLEFQSQKAANAQSRATGIVTMADDTYITAAFEYDGASAIKYWVNDVHKGTIAVTSATLPDTPLAVSFAFLNGSAGAKSITVDYLFAAIER